MWLLRRIGITVTISWHPIRVHLYSNVVGERGEVRGTGIERGGFAGTTTYVKTTQFLEGIVENMRKG